MSYRRIDTQEIAEHLYQRLGREFGASNVFFDRADIEEGELWRDEVTRQVRAADMVLALIGPKWLDTLRARLDGDDVLHFELATAVAHNKHIIPVLIGETPMPDSTLLPQDVKRIADVQALTIVPDALDVAMYELLGRVKPSLRFALSWTFANLFGWLTGLIVLTMLIATFARSGATLAGDALTLVVAALGGALLGLCIAVPQWLALRPWFERVRFLVPIYVVVTAAAIAFAAMSVEAAGEGADKAGPVLVIILLPIVLGAALWWMVRDQLIYAGWWSIANVVAPFIGLLITGANNPGLGTQEKHLPPVEGMQSLLNLAVIVLPIVLTIFASSLLLLWLMQISEIKRRRPHTSR